jgi:hypothetical protein
MVLTCHSISRQSLWSSYSLFRSQLLSLLRKGSFSFYHHIFFAFSSHPSYICFSPHSNFRVIFPLDILTGGGGLLGGRYKSMTSCQTTVFWGEDFQSLGKTLLLGVRGQLGMTAIWIWQVSRAARYSPSYGVPLLEGASCAQRNRALVSEPHDLWVLLWVGLVTDYRHTMAKSLILCGPNSNPNPKEIFGIWI